MPGLLIHAFSTVPISVNELTFAANQINNTLLTKPFQVYLILAAIYFVLCFSLTQVARTLERRIAAQRAGLLPGKGASLPQPQPVV